MALVDNSSGRGWYVASRVPRRWRRALIPRKTQIKVYELLAVTVAVRTFANELRGRRIVAFIDNTCALNMVIRGASRKGDANGILHHVWLELAMLGVHAEVAMTPINVECGRWAVPRMFHRCARHGLILAHGAVGDQAPQIVTRVKHVVKRGARVKGRTRRSRGWGRHCGDAVCTNTVHAIGAHKHGAYGGLVQKRCSGVPSHKTVHYLGRLVFTKQWGKSCE